MVRGEKEWSINPALSQRDMATQTYVRSLVCQALSRPTLPHTNSYALTILFVMDAFTVAPAIPVETPPEMPEGIFLDEEQVGTYGEHSGCVVAW